MVWHSGLLAGFKEILDTTGKKKSIISGMDVGRILSGWATIVGVLLVIVAILLVSGIVSIEIKMDDDDDYFKHYDDEGDEDDGN